MILFCVKCQELFSLEVPFSGTTQIICANCRKTPLRKKRIVSFSCPYCGEYVQIKMHHLFLEKSFFRQACTYCEDRMREEEILNRIEGDETN